MGVINFSSNLLRKKCLLVRKTGPNHIGRDHRPCNRGTLGLRDETRGDPEQQPEGREAETMIYHSYLRISILNFNDVAG